MKIIGRNSLIQFLETHLGGLNSSQKRLDLEQMLREAAQALQALSSKRMGHKGSLSLLAPDGATGAIQKLTHLNPPKEIPSSPERTDLGAPLHWLKTGLRFFLTSPLTDHTLTKAQQHLETLRKDPVQRRMLDRLLQLGKQAETDPAYTDTLARSLSVIEGPLAMLPIEYRTACAALLSSRSAKDISDHLKDPTPSQKTISALKELAQKPNVPLEDDDFDFATYACNILKGINPTELIVALDTLDTSAFTKAAQHIGCASDMLYSKQSDFLATLIEDGLRRVQSCDSHIDREGLLSALKWRPSVEIAKSSPIWHHVETVAKTHANRLLKSASPLREKADLAQHLFRFLSATDQSTLISHLLKKTQHEYSGKNSKSEAPAYILNRICVPLYESSARLTPDQLHIVFNFYEKNPRELQELFRKGVDTLDTSQKHDLLDWLIVKKQHSNLSRTAAEYVRSRIPVLDDASASVFDVDRAIEQEIRAHRLFKPRATVQVGSYQFEMSKLFDCDGRKMAIGLVKIDRDGLSHHEARLFYKSVSQNEWRCPPYIEGNHLVKGDESYVAETRLSTTLASYLEAEEKKPEKLGSISFRWLERFFDCRSPLLPTNYRDVLKTRYQPLAKRAPLPSLASLQQRHHQPGTAFSIHNKTPMTLAEVQGLDSPNWVSNFSQGYQTRIIEGQTQFTYPIQIDTEDAHLIINLDRSGRLWGDLQYPPSSASNAYGHTHFINAGPLQFKPLEYGEQASHIPPEWRLPFDDDYYDETPMIGQNPLLRRFVEELVVDPKWIDPDPAHLEIGIPTRVFLEDAYDPMNGILKSLNGALDLKIHLLGKEQSQAVVPTLTIINKNATSYTFSLSYIDPKNTEQVYTLMIQNEFRAHKIRVTGQGPGLSYEEHRIGGIGSITHSLQRFRYRVACDLNPHEREIASEIKAKNEAKMMEGLMEMFVRRKTQQ